MKYIHAAFVAIIVLLSGMSTPAHADIEEIIGDQFGSMMNVTSPAAYAGARRGVLTGGSIEIRNKRVNPVLFSFRSPKIKAGCGGISIFGGAFSAINMDEMVEYLRSIMSNALSYLFQLGITAICPSCANVLNNLESIANKIGNSLKDSCEAGKMIAGFAKPAMDTWSNNWFNEAAGAAEQWTDKLVQEYADGQDAADRAFGENAAAASEAFERNVVLEAIRSSDVLTSFLGPAADETAKLLFAEQIMSILGTVTFVKESGVDGLVTKPFPGGRLSVRHLLWGKLNAGDPEAVLYKCEEYGDPPQPVQRCLNMSEGTKDVIGLSERIGYLLVGPAYGGGRSVAELGLSSDTEGIYQKIVSDTELSEQEKALLAVTMIPAFPVLREYGLNGGAGGGGTGAAMSISRVMADMIAADILSEILVEIMNEVNRGVMAEQMEKGRKDLDLLKDQIEVTRKQIEEELKKREQGRIHTLAALTVHYQAVRDSLHGAGDPNALAGRTAPGS